MTTPDTLTEPRTPDAVRWDTDHVMKTYARNPVEFVRGSGVWLEDAAGTRYLDLLAGIAVNSVGHSHPRLTAAIAEQAGRLIHVSNLFLTAPQARLARRLVELSDFERVFFCNSGAEAIEGAIKLARKYGRAIAPQKVRIVTATNSFHGRTLAAVTATGQPKYHEPFAPLPPGFDYVPFDNIAALEAAVTDETAAILLEPIQGEGGVIPARPEYLAAARRLADRVGALLIFDEVQTGVGRTGRFWAYQHSGIVPDVLTSAKGLGGGVPIGALLARGSAAEVFQAGDHGSTFAGNPLATAAANTVLDILADEHLVENARTMGARFETGLAGVAARRPDLVGPTRGAGLMLGLALMQPLARAVAKQALARGLIVNAPNDQTIRLLPPLTISPDEVDQGVALLEKALVAAATH
jgi:predicted acetylornithine/succinylornithine family transaminase